MESPRIHREGWLYVLAFLLALILRLINLGAWPLTDFEAAPALQALQLAQGLKPELDPQPAYILLTAPLFFGFGGGTNFLARLIPALAGSCLVFLPLLFRHRLPALPAVLLAFFLAFDPGLLALSRQAGSSILALAFLMYAWACWEHKRTRLAGVFAGLALLGGTSIWMGVLALGLAWAISQGLNARREKYDDDQPAEPPSPDPGLWKPALMPLLFTLLLIGTLFLLAPGGLNAALASLPAFLSGWWTPSGVPGTRLVLALFFYQPLVTLLAVSALVRGWRDGDRDALRLSLWMLVALLLAVFHPGHQVTDLGWTLIPLLTLAALELARFVDIQPEEWVEVGGVTLLTALILIFAWIDLASLLWIPVPSQAATERVGLFFGSLVLLAVSLVLVALGWSVRAAQRGGLWGAVIALSLFSLAAAFSAGGLRAARTPELWSPGPYASQADLVVSTIDDLSGWERGYVNSLAITVTDVRNPALLWALREYPVDLATTLDMASAPPVVITSQQADPSLAAVYRGQDFAWLQTPQWEGLAFKSPWEMVNHWLRWLILRDLPQTSDTLLLWARDDLFLDAIP